LLDGFAACGWIIDGNGNPQALSSAKTGARRMKALVDGIDLFAEQACDGRSEDAREFGLQQMAQGAAEALALLGIVGGAACGRTLVHSCGPPFLPDCRVFSAGWTRSQIWRMRA